MNTKVNRPHNSLSPSKNRAHLQTTQNLPFSIFNRSKVKDSGYKIKFTPSSSQQKQPLLSLNNDNQQEQQPEIMPHKFYRGGGGAALSNFIPRLFHSLTILLVLLSFVYVVFSLEATANGWKSSKANKNLLLTPFINEGKIEEGRKLAKVEKLFPGIESYSGFLTVDEECKSHLFFWFFPASSKNESAPLILWHGGGPGTSGLFGLFQGTGPVSLNDEGNELFENKFALTQNRSVLYLDSPVGVGFSFSESGEICYANSSDDVAVGVIEALRQFYVLFPEYDKNSLYLASSSYGGKFLPVIAWRIENANQLDSFSGDANLTNTSINLKGIISISGFSDPINQIDYGDFYYNLGLIDGTQLKHFLGQEALGKSFIKNGRYFEAYKIVDPLIVGIDGAPSYLKNVTGINYPYNFVKDIEEKKSEELMFRHNNFLNRLSVHEAIHVDLASASKTKFESSSDAVYNNLVSDLYGSVGRTVEDLLKLGKYKFLFTSGQFDLIVPHTTVLKFLHELRWDGQQDFKEKGNSILKCKEGKGKVVGHGKSMDNLTYIMFRNAGHHPFIDQPECTLEILLNFTE